jgi:hypothetical protein
MRDNCNEYSPETHLREFGLPFINSLIGEIHDAFICHPVFQAFSIFDPRNLPDTVAELADYGMV